MSWGTGTVTTTTPPPVHRPLRLALIAPLLAGLLWAALNLVAVGFHLRNPATSDDLSVFILGVGVVVLGAIGFVVVLISTLLGLWARDDVSRLGWATSSAIVAALGGGVWAWVAVRNPEVEPGMRAAVGVSALVLFAPAGLVVRAWRVWSQD